MKDFEQAWRQILKIARSESVIYTISHKNRNSIVSVEPNSITVRSEASKTGNSRKLPKSDFRKVWNHLAIHKQVTCRNDKEVIVPNQRIIMAFLARLQNCVKVTHKPQTLHLTDC